MTATDDFLPSTYLTVLSILGNGAAYGYEVNNIIERYGYREWVELQFSSVYKALSELEKRGLVEGRKKNDAVKTSKKTYHLTRKGRNTLKKQITMCLSNPPRPKTLFDLGVSAMSLLSREEAVDALFAYKANLEDHQKFLESNVQNFDNLERLRRNAPESKVGRITVQEYDQVENLGAVRALFDRPAWSIRCQIAWIESFIKQIESGEGFTFRDTSKR
ncbi:MAG: helix-turn-helix transcriptional regulator [Candidatus Thorarchaeota archaeon]|nr:helix-turn-helix transcriptional regulator [Candidatus Thorarchaeota archaeon]